MSLATCGQCGGPLALVDAVCPACHTPVPAAGRRALILARAEALAADERWGEAARMAVAAPGEGLEPAETKRLLRQRAVWLQRQGSPASLEEAQALLKKVVVEDPADNLAHQVWMDLLKRLGRQAEAKAHYQACLALNPDDAVSKRQLSVMRLSADFVSAPPPKLALGNSGKAGTMEKWIKPTPKKMISAGSVVLFGLGGMVWNFFYPTAAPVAAAVAKSAGSLSDSAAVALAQSASGPGSWVANPAAAANSPMMHVLSDPWINGIQVALALAYLWWGWKDRRG